MSEIRAVIEKEWREQYYRGRKFTGQFWMTVTVFPFLALAAATAGIFIAAMMAHEGIPTAVVAMVPPFAALALMQLMGTMSMQLGLDSIAGERERHTLDTLLAAPISTRDLFLGKLLLPAIIAFVLTQTVIVLAGVASAFFLGPWTLVWMVVAMFGVLVTVMPSAIGGVAFAMIFSARSESIKAAQQKMAIAMIPFYILFFGFTFSTSSGGFNPETLPAGLLIGIAIGIFALFLGSSVLFVILAYRGFRRERLILA